MFNSWKFKKLIVILLSTLIFVVAFEEPKDELAVLAVATRKTCEVNAFLRSVINNGLSYKLLGEGLAWTGFGQKMLFLKKELEAFRNDSGKIILFSDAFDVLINAGADEIVERFKKFDARILFSADSNCWPDEYLCSKVPFVTEGKRLLNAGLFIGYAKELYTALHSVPLQPELEHDQHFFYQIYTNDILRKELRIKLDHRSELFQTVDSGLNSIEIVFKDGKPQIHNKDHQTYPLLIHTPSYCKGLFHALSAFIPNLWNDDEQEDDCSNRFIGTSEVAQVSIAILLDKIQTDLANFMEKIAQMEYPKEKIHLYIRRESGENHNEVVTHFLENHQSKYSSIKVVKLEDNKKKYSLKALGFASYFEGDCSHYFNLNDVSLLENPQLLRLLLGQDRNATASFLRLQDQTGGKHRHFMFFLSRYDHCNNHVNIFKEAHRMIVGMF